MTWKLAFIISGIIIILCPVFSVLVGLWYNKKKLNKSICKAVMPIKESAFKRICFDFPFCYVTDLFNRSDFEFTQNGFHLIVGEQGSGKTITCCYLLKKYKHDFPYLRIRTNMNYIAEDLPIKSWRDLVFSNNGVYGEIDVLDEVQNWFNSLQSKDFPPEMLQEISQQRKQRKMIIGTSQVWNRVAKPIREQVKLVYKPFTIGGCLTICPIFKPVINDDGQADKMLFRKCFFFVHTKDIRNSYDTYKKIEMMSLKGFKSEELQYNNLHTTTNANCVPCAKM